VESMTDDFNPDRYHDDYQEQLQELVQAKLEGGEAFTSEEQEPKELDETEDVSDLLAKLEASVKARREGRASAKKAPAKKAAAKKAPAKKTAAKKTAKKTPAKKAAKKSAAKK
jgi:DNA end-binding protein Ku